MLIDSIEHGLLLMADDAERRPVVSAQFANLEEMNAFIVAHRDEFAGLQTSLAFEEISHGKFGGFCMSFGLPEFAPVGLRRLREMARDYANEMHNPTFKPDIRATLHPFRDDGCRPGEKAGHLADVSYICPHCYHTADVCTCRFYPHYLVQIDTAMVPLVRILNTKGYRTTSCCAGHASQRSANICVGFDLRYPLEVAQLPEGATYWKMRPHVSYDLVEGYTPDEFAAYQRKAIDGLEAWAAALPDAPEEFRVRSSRW